MIVRLGRVPSKPLLRTYAARREISPIAGSERKVATTLALGKSLSGPAVDASAAD
jgi:hypothetical protein